MKDEIKQILDRMKDDIKEHWHIAYEPDVELSFDEAKLLLDYITNLQEENERLREVVENLTTMTVCGDKKQIKNTAQYKLDIYKSRKILQEFQKDLKNISNGDKE